MLNSELEQGQTAARDVLMNFLLNVSIGRLYEDVFLEGSLTEHWVVPPSKRGEDLHAILFVFAFDLASCEAHFMMLGEFMYLSCLRLSL